MAVDKRLILALDRNPHNLALLCPFLERAGYHVHTTASEVELEQALQGGETPGLVIIDLSGFDRGLWARCEVLRRAHIPLIVVSATRGAALEQECRLHGARAILIRPILMTHLLRLISSLLER